MLSRVGEAIFWMSRYIERAENYARIMGVNLNLTLDLPPGLTQQWEPIIRITGDEEDYEKRYTDFNRDNVVKFMTFDPENPNSILSCLQAARENARSVRENISTEMWEHLNEFYLHVKEIYLSNQWPFIDHIEFYNSIRKNAHTFAGITSNTLSHSDGYRFVVLGRYLERADKTTRILDVKYFLLLPGLNYIGSQLDLLQWGALLKSVSALEMYNKKYMTINNVNIVEFLLLDRDFPRTVFFCLNRANRELGKVSGADQTGMTMNLPQKLLGRLESEISYRDSQEIINNGLHEYLDHIQTRLNEIGVALHDTFFDLRTNQ
ncbi:MAG: alpha-E domain-containing protein [Leptospiraceae bacterium]|nr:alpha-E domain-containing protein [Leptospiraceae bacterium]